MEEIKNEKSDIKEQISIAKEILDEKNEKLREAFEIVFNGLKNPMSINKEIKSELELFEKNLTKKEFQKELEKLSLMKLLNRRVFVWKSHDTRNARKH